MSTPWRNPRNWPFDLPGGYTFAGRAVERVGRALFGDDWSGDEFRVSIKWKRPVHDAAGDLTALDAWRIYECLKENAPNLCPEQAVPRPNGKAQEVRGAFGLTAEQVAAANAIFADGSSRYEEVWGRGFEVCAALGKACLGGEVQAFYRDSGGQPQPVRAELWATTPMVAYSRISQLRINPKTSPDDPWIMLDGHSASPWLFFGERGVRDLVARLTGEPAQDYDPSSETVVPMIEGAADGHRPSYFAFASDPDRRELAHAFAETKAEREGHVTLQADKLRWMQGEWRRLYHETVDHKVFADAYKPSHVKRRKSEHHRNIGGTKLPLPKGHGER